MTILLMLLFTWMLVDLLALVLRAVVLRSRLSVRVAPSIRGRDLVQLCRGDMIVRAWRLPRFLSWRSAAMRLT
jgi:hypothetical protein